MRLFAGDHFPRLAVQSGDLPRPWVMPLGLPRAHRDRLALLLAQALRALEPDLKLVQLRWAERHALLAGRINLPSPVLVWWRVDAVPVVDPQTVVIDGSKMTPGLTLYDFDQEVSLPAEAWLGPLKMGVLHRILDRLLDERPVRGYEEIADAVREISAKLVSPIDLVDAAEAMVESEAQGEGLDAAKAEAIGRVVAGRFATGPAEAAVRALVAVGRGEALGAEGREALRKAGFADTGGMLPILDLLCDQEVLRRALLHVAALRRFEGSIAELAPGLFPEAEGRAVPTQAGRDIVSTQVPSPVEARSPGLPEPHAMTVRTALKLVEDGDAESGARLLLRSRQQRDDSAWSNDDLHAAGLTLYRLAINENRRCGQNIDPATIERIAALYDAASEWLERSSAAPEVVVMSLVGAGIARATLDQWDAAEALFERGRKLADAADDWKGLAFCMKGLSQMKLLTGRAQEAIEDAEAFVRLFQRLGMRSEEGSGLTTIGDAMVQLDQLDQARAAYERALAAFDDVGDPIGRADTLRSRGRLWQLDGNVKKARQDFEEALSLAREHKNRLHEAAAHEELGELSLRRSEPLRAREAYEEAAPIYHSLSDRAGEARTIEGLGDACASMNDVALARDAYHAALELARELGNPSWEAALLFKCAGVRRQGGDHEGALREYEEAARLYEQTGDCSASGRALMELGNIKAASRDWPNAASWFEQAVARFREADERARLSEALHSLGSVLFLANQTERARKVLLEAVDVARADGNEQLAAEVKLLLDHLDEDTGARPGVARS
ncbi:tetratricopeptide repeat protein [Sorangium sp. So ce1000]|uniref:tetratricopeptide repeat protein n=1 Tax=Sorangium sp. So ce1000 TaxID=3133325 RepID=UPI003F602CC7